MFLNRITGACLALLLLSWTLPAKAPVSEQNPANAIGMDLGASVVRIAVTDQEADYHSP